MIEDFRAWNLKIQPEIDHIINLLSQPISDEPEQLIQDIIEIEAWNARTQMFLTEANSWLEKAKHRYKPDRDLGTELDRKIELDNSVTAFKSVRDKMEGLVESIKQRLSISQSILSYYRQFMEKKL